MNGGNSTENVTAQVTNFVSFGLKPELMFYLAQACAD
jgi:hypothetical protein